MTVIAAITDGRTVWMGADNAGTCDDLRVTASKIRRLQASATDGEQPNPATEYLVGFSGDRAAGALFEAHLKATGPDPDDDSDDIDRWAQSVAEAWAGVVDDTSLGPWHAGTDRDAPAVNATALLAIHGRLYRLSTNLAVPAEQPFAAIGEGASIAYGAFHASQSVGDPETRLRLAIDAAVTWGAHCYPPGRYETLEPRT